MNFTRIKSILSFYYHDLQLTRSRSFIKSIVFIVAFVFCTNVNAIKKTATANNGNGWSVANNWSPSGVPQSGDTVIIPGGFTLTVKGQIYGSPNPTIIVKIYGTLDFDPSGKIDLSSSSAFGIYAGGLITSNGTSSELINIGGVTKFNGQLDGSLTGPRYSTASTGASPNGFEIGVLTIKLVSFDYQKINNTIKLSWTASHSNSADYFEIRRSKDANNWNILAVVPVTGNVNDLGAYTYSDNNPDKDLNYYQIKLDNFGSSNTYSKIIAVRSTGLLKNLFVFPNPANTETKILWENNESIGPIEIKVMNQAMIPVLKQKVKQGDNYAIINIRTLPSGIYTIIISDSYSLKESAKLIVNNN